MPIETIQVQTASRRYPVLIGEGLLDNTEALRAAIGGSQVLLLSNTTVAPLFAAHVRAHLAGLQWVERCIDDGEIHKNWATAGAVLETLASLPASRDCTLIALGGGVVGDLGGFVAATYMRGIRFIQIPTTLLAMVDSSVGGKTAVNLPAGKNLAGAFWQPQRVLIDPQTLRSLPAREFRAGLAEVVKYAALGDREFFAWLEAHANAVLALEPAAIRHAIHTSVAHKAAIVGRDETEQGERALLNLGHTFGHAIEAAQHYRGLLHGEAVAIGMVLAARLSARLGLAPLADSVRLEALLQALGLPITVPDGLAGEQLVELMRGDKKNLSGRIRLILWNGIGEARLPEAVEPDVIRSVFD